MCGMHFATKPFPLPYNFFARFIRTLNVLVINTHTQGNTPCVLNLLRGVSYSVGYSLENTDLEVSHFYGNIGLKKIFLPKFVVSPSLVLWWIMVPEAQR